MGAGANRMFKFRIFLQLQEYPIFAAPRAYGRLNRNRLARKSKPREKRAK